MSTNSTDGTGPTDGVSGEKVFHPERTHVFAALLMIGISLMVIGVAPLRLFWILIFPALFIWWALRSQVTVTDDGVSIRYAFRSGVTASWDEIEGVGFKGAKTLLRTTDGKEHPMPGVTFNSLPELAAASRGRIPDALTAGLEAQDGKVSVINQDGNQVLMTQEEHAAYLASQRKQQAPDGTTDA